MKISIISSSYSCRSVTPDAKPSNAIISNTIEHLSVRFTECLRARAGIGGLLIAALTPTPRAALKEETSPDTCLLNRLLSFFVRSSREHVTPEMNKLRQSLRRKKPTYVPEASRPHQWQADEEAVRKGKCNFAVRVSAQRPVGSEDTSSVWMNTVAGSNEEKSLSDSVSLPKVTELKLDSPVSFGFAHKFHNKVQACVFEVV